MSDYFSSQSRRERFYNAVLDTYNSNKPDSWPRKKTIYGDFKRLLDRKFDQLKVSESEFLEMLALALQHCSVDQFALKNFTFSTLLRFNSAWLTEFAEKRAFAQEALMNLIEPS